ncbi:UDP-Glycosyltransferase/glycogen phosphorylase, partial [Hyphopichia burtonii NRRL Y-1933]
QKSIVENLDPHILKEGLLIKFKENELNEINQKKEEQTKKLQLKKEKLRLKIAEKLQKVFDLDPDDYFYCNYDNWLIMDVLLQGHLYLTRDNLLFFAFLPSNSGSTGNPKTVDEVSRNDSHLDDSDYVIHSGSLGIKTAQYGDSYFSTMITHRFWVVLREETLTVYRSPTDLYFPMFVVDLKTATHAEIIEKDLTVNTAPAPQNNPSSPLLSPKGPRSRHNSFENTKSRPSLRRDNTDYLSNSDDDSSEASSLITQDYEEGNETVSGGVWIKLVTKKKNYRFHTDNLYSARQWVNTITKVLFQLHNSNSRNEVLIKIPIENIVDFKNSYVLTESDDADRDEESPLSFCFKVKIKINDQTTGNSIISDQTSNVDINTLYFLFFRGGEGFNDTFNQVIYDRLSHNQKNQGDDASTNTLTVTDRLKETARKMSHSSLQRSNSLSRLRRIGKTLTSPSKVFGKSKSVNDLISSDSQLRASVSLTSSPMTGVAGSNTIHLPRRLSVTGLKNLNMSFETSQRRMDVAESRDPSEYKNDNKKQNKVKSIGKTMKVLANVGNLWAAHPSHYQNIQENDPYYVTDDDAREVALKRYQEHFSLSYDKKLVATYYTHLQRAIPVYGKLYLSETELCFRSLLPGVNTRMILPLSHIENCYKEKGMKITHSGLVILIIGQEEVFLEFGSHKARDDCERMILQQLETFHQDEGWAPLDHRPESLHEFEFRGADVTNNEVNDSVASSKIQNARIKLFEDKLNAAAGIDIPLILEDSPFFKTEIKPSTSYNLTLLTIGSRGDVQPYIALAKGLKAEGHNVTIATHKEFEPWISKYNIQFKEIAGNPAELMHLMVEHGSMSVAFLKEASSKFRSWINDLLASSWEACQGTDILIESPSAMGGVHIAEALGIPYMRAFTMPWTRTRAYPHAFIVPDQKKGGSYNYLTHVMFENVFWKGISGQVNKWRVEQLGLPRTNLFKLQQTKIPFLYNVSPTIFPPSVDFPDWVKVTGYWFLDEGAAKDYDPPKDLLEFIDSAYRDQKKIVYIGFGSIVVSNATSLTKAVIEAVLDADVRCILNKGWSDRLSNDEKDKVEVELPPEIYDSGAVPHDWLFKRIDACVHHGGSGTTGASLRSGLPTVIKPFFGDQFFYASRVEEVGVGIALKKLNAKSLSKALKTVTTDLKIVEKAKKTSERMRNENGVATAIEAIYSELEYARTLITVKQQHNEQSRANALKSGTQTPVVYEDDEYESVEEGVDDDYDLGSESDYEEEISDESNQKTTPSSKNSPDSTKDPVQSADSDDEEDLTNPVPAFPKKKSDKAIHLPSNLKPENCQWFHF